MKKRILFILITVLGCMLSIAVQADSVQGDKINLITPIQTTTPVKKPKTVTYYYRVDGMVCSICAFGVEKQFKKIENVSAVDVDLNKGIVTITGIQPLTFTNKQLKDLFNNAGMTYRCQVKTLNGQCNKPK